MLKPGQSGIIAEFKRRSPSKGIINENASVEGVTEGYIQAGASALSILTDWKFFGGSNDDLTKARKINFSPILRKDFIVDEYQILEAKSIGADAILLIAACLTKIEIEKFAAFTKSLELEVLLELHDEDELKMISNEVDLEISKKMAGKIPSSFTKIAESGIDSPEKIKDLKNYGFKGFLIGEHFMKTSQPEKTCEEFIKQLMN